MASGTAAINLTLWGPNGTEIFPSPNYKDPTGQRVFLYANATVRLLLGVLSILSNGFLIRVTSRNKNELKTICSWLLAVTAFLDCLVAISPLVSAVLTPVGQVSGAFCLWTVAVPNVAFGGTLVLIFVLAFDRLVATLAPLFHRTLNVARCVCTATLVSLAFGLYLFSFAVAQWSTNGQSMFKCSMTDLWMGSFGFALQQWSLGFTVAAVLCYAAIWVRLRFWAVANLQVNRGILNSLVVLLLILLVGWICAMQSRSLILHLIPNPVPLGYILMNTTELIIAFNGAFNAFVLYFCSKDYRRIMRAELKRLRFCCQTQTAPQQQTMNLFTVRHNNQVVYFLDESNVPV